MNLSLNRKVWLLAVLLVNVSLIIGCGDGRPKRVPVSGQVLVDEQPLPGGFVRIVPANGRAATGQIDAQGHFSLTTYDKNDGCMPGTHNVEVTFIDTSNPNVYRSLIPEKYNNADTSGLSVTIDGPTDDLTIRITRQGWRPSMGQSTAGDSDPSKLE
ncbi:MAG: hypothetical protein JXM70_17875 [Pirellulales bacterium]|nr:hypothetical protein [Pirellulales bacterium]